MSDKQRTFTIDDIDDMFDVKVNEAIDAGYRYTRHDIQRRYRHDHYHEIYGDDESKPDFDRILADRFQTEHGPSVTRQLDLVSASGEAFRTVISGKLWWRERSEYSWTFSQYYYVTKNAIAIVTVDYDGDDVTISGVSLFHQMNRVDDDDHKHEPVFLDDETFRKAQRVRSARERRKRAVYDSLLAGDLNSARNRTAIRMMLRNNTEDVGIEVRSIDSVRRCDLLGYPSRCEAVGYDIAFTDGDGNKCHLVVDGHNHKHVSFSSYDGRRIVRRLNIVPDSKFREEQARKIHSLHSDYWRNEHDYESAACRSNYYPKEMLLASFHDFDR